MIISLHTYLSTDTNLFSQLDVRVDFLFSSEKRVAMFFVLSASCIYIGSSLQNYGSCRVIGNWKSVRVNSNSVEYNKINMHFQYRQKKDTLSQCCIIDTVTETKIRLALNNFLMILIIDDILCYPVQALWCIPPNHF